MRNNIRSALSLRNVRFHLLELQQTFHLSTFYTVKNVQHFSVHLSFAA